MAGKQQDTSLETKPSAKGLLEILFPSPTNSLMLENVPRFPIFSHLPQVLTGTASAGKS